MSNISPRHHDAVTPTAIAAEAAASLNADFMEAAIAAGALLAHADGEMAVTERRKLLGLVRAHAALSIFSSEQMADEMGTHEANFRLDPEVAQVLAREKLVQVANRPRLARKVLAICREIIPADGVRHPAEYRVLGEIREMLGLDDEPRQASPRR